MVAVTPENKFKSIIDLTGTGWTQTIGSTSIVNGKWYTIVTTYDGSSIKLYVDGILDAQSSANGNVIDPVQSSSFFIGVRQDQQQHFTGNIGDLTIWKKTLSLEEILHYSSNSFSGSEQGLVGYWNFDEGSGDVLSDLWQ